MSNFISISRNKILFNWIICYYIYKECGITNKSKIWGCKITNKPKCGVKKVRISHNSILIKKETKKEKERNSWELHVNQNDVI